MEVSAMIDLTRNRRKIFAFTGLFVLLLAAVLLLLPPEISPALGGGVGLEYRIHAVFNDEEEQQLAESSLIQTASDTLGLPVEGSLVPSSAQENLWLLQLRLDPADEIPYDDFQDLTYALINSFPGWTFQTTAGISQTTLIRDIRHALTACLHQVEDCLPEALRRRLDLCDAVTACRPALVNIFFTPPGNHSVAAVS